MTTVPTLLRVIHCWTDAGDSRVHLGGPKTLRPIFRSVSLPAFEGEGGSLRHKSTSQSLIYCSFVLFLLPGGRPRLLVCDIQAGGLPRRRPLPRANRSSTTIASSICSRSLRKSANILLMSISRVYCTYSLPSLRTPLWRYTRTDSLGGRPHV
jgi:hypothetical protein